MKAPPYSQPPRSPARALAAFTLVEIALSLAVIAFALVAIIGVLPSGLNVQRENREETIINQDASIFLSALRNGARGLDDLTNYVMVVTNFYTTYHVIRDGNGFPIQTNYVAPPDDPVLYPYWFTPTSSSFGAVYSLTNGTNIIGVMSTPKYLLAPGADNYYSNFVVAYVRAISGLATEKPPQDNADVRVDSFAYRLICENQQVPAYVEPGTDPLVPPPASDFTRQLTNNLRELRLTFRWPLNFQGNTGNGRQTYRIEMGGYLRNDPKNSPLWCMLPTTFYNTTNSP